MNADKNTKQIYDPGADLVLVIECRPLEELAGENTASVNWASRTGKAIAVDAYAQVPPERQAAFAHGLALVTHDGSPAEREQALRQELRAKGRIHLSRDVVNAEPVDPASLVSMNAELKQLEYVHYAGSEHNELTIHGSKKVEVRGRACNFSETTRNEAMNFIRDYAKRHFYQTHAEGYEGDLEKKTRAMKR